MCPCLRVCASVCVAETGKRVVVSVCPKSYSSLTVARRPRTSGERADPVSQMKLPWSTKSPTTVDVRCP